MLGAPIRQDRGTIAEIGENVLRWNAGDALVAFLPLDADGAAAEFAPAPAESLATAPASVSLADAAPAPEPAEIRRRTQLTTYLVVTDLVPAHTRAVAFGWLALLRGGALLIAGALLGAAYDVSLAVTIALILVANTAALISLIPILRRLDPASTSGPHDEI